MISFATSPIFSTIRILSNSIKLINSLPPSFGHAAPPERGDELSCPREIWLNQEPKFYVSVLIYPIIAAGCFAMSNVLWRWAFHILYCFLLTKHCLDFLQFCEMKQREKNLYITCHSHTPKWASLPVAGCQNIMSSCSLIHHKWAQWLSTPHNQTPQLTSGRTWTCTRHTEPQGTVTLLTGPWEPWQRERKRAGLSRRWSLPGVYSSSDGVFILRVTCFFRTKPNSFLSLTAAAQPQPLLGTQALACPCRRGHWNPISQSVSLLLDTAGGLECESLVSKSSDL